MVFAALIISLFTTLFGCKRMDDSSPGQFNAAEWEQKIKSPTLTADEFTQLYAQIAAADSKVAQVKITSPLEILITLSDGSQLKSSLGNTWAEAAKNPNGRADICRYYLKSVLSIAKREKGVVGAAETNSVVPTIKDDSFLQQFPKDTSGHGIVSEPFVADLHIVYATDRDGIIAFLMESDRKRFNLEVPELRSLAVANLKSVLHPIKRLGESPLFGFTTDDGYCSSLLLLDDLWKTQTNSVQGDIIVAVPARDILLFTGSSSTNGIREIRAKVEEIRKNGSHLVSDTLLIRKNGHWEKFTE
jgi:uncharacterized protein YtpQ (UPF0354 family)